MKKFQWIAAVLLAMVLGGCHGGGGTDAGIQSPGAGTNPSTQQLPPDPASVAPSLRSATVTPMIDRVSFLYRSDPPVQSGVDEKSIDEATVAVVRGRVLDKEDEPLSGVKVSVLDHPEYGYTYSRSDGVFDMAVNGGAQLTLTYEKEGYLTLQRSATVPKLDYFVFESVVMTPLSRRVARVDLAAQGEAVAVVKGERVSDTRGTRQSTLFFERGTGASIRMPDGSLKPIGLLHVRSTEYTVGDNGPQAMPAELPEGVAYTYCVEFTVDEAEAAGGVGVEFDRPVVHYVENFLGFAVGDEVPTYRYDKEAAKWLTLSPGRVVAIVGEKNGRAEIDIDGDGNADDVANLLGISDAERERLATLYDPGDELWRTPLAHFSPIDHNWPIPDPPANATPPDEEEIVENHDEEEEESCDADGSIINIESRALGEAILLPGSDLALVYDSSRTSGDKRQGVLTLRLLGGSWSDKLDEIRVFVSIAGSTYVTSYERFEQGLKHRFAWDGKDAYGRTVVGDAIVHARIVYYYLMNEDVAAGSRSVATGVNTRDTVIVLNPPSRPRQGPSYATIEREVTTTLRHTPVMPLGVEGWRLSKHHLYNGVKGLIEYGDGRRQKITENEGVGLTTVAGSEEENASSLPCDRIDGKEARALPLKGMIDHIGFDGKNNLYFMHECGLLRIAPTGTVNLVATMQRLSEWGIDADPYTYPIAVKKDGTVFIANQHLVVRVEPDGSASLYMEGEGVNVTSLSLRKVSARAADATIHFVSDMAVASDGTLYVADLGDVKKIDTKGEVFLVLASDAVEDVEVASDGTLYGLFADGRQSMILKISQNGQSEPVMSLPVSPEARFTVLDEGRFGVSWVALKENYYHVFYAVATAETNEFRLVWTGAADENTYFEDWSYSGEIVLGSGGYYLVDPFGGTIALMGGNRENGTIVKDLFSSDGRLAFTFDLLSGRHEATYDALKGTKMAAFEYDDEGLLVAYTDRSGNRVSIEYGVDGVARAIRLPHGRVELGHEARTLTTISTGGAESWRFEYGSGGLLQRALKPDGHASTYRYDDGGALESATNPEGAVTTLSRGETENGYEVRMEKTGCGSRVYGTYSFPEMVDDGSGSKRKTGYVTRRTIRIPNVGTLADINRTVNLDGTIVTDSIRLFDGTSFYRTSKKEYRGEKAVSYTPYLSRVSTPSGLERVVLTTKRFDMADAKDPRSVTGYTRVDALNGKEYRTVYDKEDGVVRRTTPEGRVVTKRYDGNGMPVSIEVGGNSPVEFAYDGEGRMTQMASGTSRYEIEYLENGNGFAVTDPLGRRTEVLTESGRIVERRFADGRVARYGYDGYGSLAAVTVPGGAAYAMEYDGNGRLSRFVPPTENAGAEEVIYDHRPDKKLSSITYKDGTKVELLYDGSGRPTRIGDVVYGYDAYGQLSRVVTDAGVTLEMGYDGFLTTEQTWSGAVTGRVEVGYDDNFWAVSLAVDGDAVDKIYDDDGLLIQSGAMRLQRRASDGFVTATSLGSVTSQTRYDERGDVESYEIDGLARFEYARDALGRIVEVNETVDGASVQWRYSYDEAGRLAGVVRGSETYATYEYDAAGRRTGAACDLQGRVVAKNGAAYGYDAAGRRTTKEEGGGRTVYRYNAMGDLVAVSLPDGTEITYTLDGFHRRVAKDVNGTRRWGMLYKDGLHPVAQLDAAGRVAARFVYAEKRHVPSYMIKDAEAYRLVSDHLGSVRLVVRVSDGNVTQRIDYDVWGRVIEDTNPGFQPFGFAGGLYDPETGLVHFGAREYDPSTGSWTSREPKLFARGELNLYEYAGNDPINRIDADGMLWEEVGSIVGRAAGTIGRVADSISGGLDTIGQLLGLAEDVEDAISTAEEFENAENAFEDHLMTEDDEVNEQAYELYNRRRNGLANFASACAALANDLNDFFGGWF